MELCSKNDPMVCKIFVYCRKKNDAYCKKYASNIDQALPRFDELFQEINLDGLVVDNGILWRME